MTIAEKLETDIGRLRRLFSRTNNHHAGFALEVAASILEYAKSLEKRIDDLEAEL